MTSSSKSCSSQYSSVLTSSCSQHSSSRSSTSSSSQSSHSGKKNSDEKDNYSDTFTGSEEGRADIGGEKSSGNLTSLEGARLELQLQKSTERDNNERNGTKKQCFGDDLIPREMEKSSPAKDDLAKVASESRKPEATKATSDNNVAVAAAASIGLTGGVLETAKSTLIANEVLEAEIATTGDDSG